MVAQQHIQAATIRLLKAYAPLVALVGDDIREDEWQGTTFTYPNVRVAMGPQVPYSECFDQQAFYVLCFSEEASSNQCMYIANLVYSALAEINFTDSNFKSMEIEWAQTIPPFHVANGVWRTEVHFVVNIW